MKIHILHNKINYNQEGEEIEIDDNFFNNYPFNIDNYFFEIINWKINWKIDKNNEKNLLIKQFKDLLKQSEELRSKYLSSELLPDSELKTETLRILKEKWDIVMDQYIKKQNILIEKYGIEILQEIL